jgi:altronate hydrolase
VRGYLRQDGRKGIRNHVVVAFLVECARHVAEEIADPFSDNAVQLIGFPSCYPSIYGDVMLNTLGAHPNVGAVLLISLGCESFRGGALERAINASGRPAKLLTIQHAGGTRSTIAAGRDWVTAALARLKEMRPVEAALEDLGFGLLPGLASLETMHLLGHVTDRLIGAGAAVIVDDLAKGRGLRDRAASPEIASRLTNLSERAAYCRALLGDELELPAHSHGFAGHAPVAGLLHPAQPPPSKGLYLLDNVPPDEPRYGPIDLSPAVAAAELAACGVQLLIAAADDGQLAGSALLPVIKVGAASTLSMDLGSEVDATDVDETMAAIRRAMDGQKTKAEQLGYCDFALAHKGLQTERGIRS